MYFDNPKFFDNMDYFIMFALTVLPTDFLAKQLEKNIIEANSSIQLKNISVIVCKKLNLNPNKYAQYIKFWIRCKENFMQLEQEETLK